jgi:hypothetical protein
VALSLDDLEQVMARQDAGASPTFTAKVGEVSRRLGINPDDLMAVMKFETGGTLDPAQRNQAGSGATGLIQFMPATARRLGTTTDALARMTPEQQLDYVEKYYQPYKGKITNLNDTYMAVLYPAALGKPEWYPFIRGDQQPTAYRQNQGLDREGKGSITVGDAVQAVKRFVTPGVAEAAERPRTQGARQAPAGPLTVEGLEQLLGTAAPVQPPRQAQGPPSPAIPAAAPQNAPQATTGPQGSIPLSRPPTQPLVDPRASQTGPRPTAPSDLVVDIEKPSAGQAPPPEDPRLLADLPGWAKVGLATGTGILGGVGGAAVGSLGGPVGTVAGEMGGSYLARKLNVALGLEDPGIVGDVASAALPGVFRGLGAAWRGGLRHGLVPGTGAARHEMAKEAIEGLEGRLAQGTPAADLWTLARQSNPDVATLQSWQTAGKVLREKQTAPGLTANDPGRLAMQDMLDMVKRTGGPVTVEDLDNFRRTLIPHLRDPGVKQLYGAILDDMENAAARGVTGAGTLRQAIARTRYEHSLDELADLWKPGGNIKVTDGDQVQVMGKTLQNAFQRKMHDNPLFAKSFSAAERDDIERTLKEVGKLTNISLAPGGRLASQLAWGTAAAGAGLVGYEQGGVKEGAMAALGVEALPYVMAAAMGTPAGRAAIRNAINQGGGKIGPAQMAGILTALREAGAFSGAIPTEERQTTRAPGGPARATD